MSSSDILVVFLSTALAIFLVLAIILVAYLIIIAKQVRHITDSASRTIDTIEDVTSKLQRAVAPAVASQFIMEQISRIVEKVTDKKRKQQDEE